jgi:hypothetical protein
LHSHFSLRKGDIAADGYAGDFFSRIANATTKQASMFFKILCPTVRAMLERELWVVRAIKKLIRIKSTHTTRMPSCYT